VATVAVTVRYALDGSWRRTPGSGSVIAGSPLRLLRLGPAGMRAVEALERSEPVPAGADELVERLVDIGAIHPLVEPGPGTSRRFNASDVTCIVPVHLPAGPQHAVRRQRLERLVAALAPCTVVVVDDASPEPVGEVPGAVVLRRDVNGGPGVARDTGRASVGSATVPATPLIAFVDDDVTVPDGWLDGLLGHFDDDRVGLVAPRVGAPASGSSGSGALAAFDAIRSPLDLGPDPGRIAPGTRVSYVPAAALVCRADALEAIGGFDPTLRVGEDVDLVWRLVGAGRRCRYEPTVVVHHDVRPDLRGWLRQRYAYGTSAAALSLRHPGALAPVRMSAWSAAAWLFVAFGRPFTGIGLTAWTVAALHRKLGFPGAPTEAARLAGLGTLHAGRQLASVVTRVGWPLALLAALVSRRARRVVGAAVLVPAMIDMLTNDRRAKRPRLDPARYVLLRLLDDAAYGAGVWRGAVTERTVGPLTPRFESFPGHRR
jgi:mycofactocin glycosyltransferase